MQSGIIAVIGVALLFVAGTAYASTGPVSGGSVPAAVMQWASLAQSFAQKYSILDPEEILAVVWNESTGNPAAVNPGDPSYGLMGVTIPIAQYYGGVNTAASLADPSTNMNAGAGFLADLKSKYSAQHPNDWPDAYNVGETKFLAGERSPTSPTYSQNFFARAAALGAVGA